jgi:hypothetical protein
MNSGRQKKSGTPPHLPVTPAKAGVHGSAGKSRPAWIPAFAGMTKEGAGMTKEGAGMTKEGAGMTKEGAGMTTELPRSALPRSNEGFR